MGSSRQHVIQAGAICQLTPMSSLNLSWQRFEIESSSFTQDRLSLGCGFSFDPWCLRSGLHSGGSL